MSKLKLTYDKMLNYLKDSFSNKERHDFEKEVMKDPFEEEAFEGLSDLSMQEFKGDIFDLQHKIKKKTKKRSIIRMWKPIVAAASVLILFSLGLIMFLNTSKESVYEIVDATVKTEDNVVITDDKREDVFKEPENIKNEVVVAFEETETEEEIEEEVFREPIIDKSANVRSKISKPTLVLSADKEVEELVSIEPIKEKTNYNTQTDLVELINEEQVAESANVQWSGQVISSSLGEPLAGASVIIQGSYKDGVVTDFDGKYKIKASKNAVLEVLYLGFETVEVTFENRKKILLDDDLAALDEVVVVGYGTKKKKSITGSITKIKEEVLSNKANLQIEEALVGRVSGINVSSSEVSEVKAIPPQGNERSYERWIVEQLDASEFEKGKQYDVTVNFDVNKKGKLLNVKLSGIVESSEKKHIKSIILSGEKWIPAQNKNGTLKESQELVLRFHF